MIRSGVSRSAACLVVLVLGPASAASAATSYGLDWPGTGAIRRMLYWANPHTNGLPIYDATYIFRVYPRKKQCGSPASCYGCPGCDNGYWTTFFWGNNGTFAWDGGTANAYYGAHPYPGCGGGAPIGTQAWEISAQSHDCMNTNGATSCGDSGCGEVDWDRWYTQAFVASASGTTYTHKFYFDITAGAGEPASRTITYVFTNPNWLDGLPPSPALVVGQAPETGPWDPVSRCDDSGSSWGGYGGWEEFSGVIRGIQIYSNDLSLADIEAEIASPLSTTAGQSAIWYLKLDPRPDDVEDDSGEGHHPSWCGATADEWSSPGGSTPPAAPTGLRVF
jgi:hypothetical protein